MKLERIEIEIEKTKAKITGLESHLKELEQQKVEAENTSILAVVRSANLTHKELVDFIHAYKTNGPAAERMLEIPTGEEDTDEA